MFCLQDEIHEHRSLSIKSEQEVSQLRRRLESMEDEKRKLESKTVRSFATIDVEGKVHERKSHFHFSRQHCGKFSLFSQLGSDFENQKYFLLSVPENPPHSSYFSRRQRTQQNGQLDQVRQTLVPSFISAEPQNRRADGGERIGRWYRYSSIGCLGGSVGQRGRVLVPSFLPPQKFLASKTWWRGVYRGLQNLAITAKGERGEGKAFSKSLFKWGREKGGTTLLASDALTF